MDPVAPPFPPPFSGPGFSSQRHPISGSRNIWRHARIKTRSAVGRTRHSHVDSSVTVRELKEQTLVTDSDTS